MALSPRLAIGMTLKISLVYGDKIKDFEGALSQHLRSVFGQEAQLVVNHELLCAAVIEEDQTIVASGLAYRRSMKQGSKTFNAGIIGGVCVDGNKRGLGLSKIIIRELDQSLLSYGAEHAFLFAYNPDIYRWAGYSDLTSPIHFFDTPNNRWNTFVYRGGMIKSYTGSCTLDDQPIEFCGCVY